MPKKEIPKKAKPIEPKAKVQQPLAENSKLLSEGASVLTIIIITFIAFLPLLGNSYVFWDDPEYILHNPLMNAPLKAIFFGHSSFYMWNYHPLTILIYTIEHKIFGADMMGYHAVSVLFHIANSLLVFYFVYYLLSKKNTTIPLITALLFAVHPMHVESVAWASELKDVMYTFFFLASLICYVLYMQNGRKMKYLGYALILFLLSLISKGQAVTLPLSFLLVDYFLKRKWDISVLTDKLLFFILSIVFGIIAIKAQDNSISIHSNSQAFQNFFFGLYGLSLYLLKFILPINLSGLYPYPDPGVNNDSIPLIVYLAPLIIAVIVFLTLKLFRKNRFVMFGVLFFIANIFTVLKFIPVSEAIMADRYSYIPYIGLFFAVGYGFNKLLNNPLYKSYKKVVQYGGAGLLIVLASLTFARTMVWKDSFSFWGDVIKKNSRYWHPYEFMGNAYFEKSNYDSSIVYFRQGVEKDKFNQSNNSRLDLGLSYYRKGMYDEALKVYNASIAVFPNVAKAYFQRALVYQNSNHPQLELALADYSKAIELNPSYEEAYLNRGSIYVDNAGKYDEGIADFNKVLELDPDNIDAVINRGVAFYMKGNFDEALNIFNSIIDKISDNKKIYYFEAIAYAGKKDYAKALQYGTQAQNKGFPINPELLKDWKSKQ